MGALRELLAVFDIEVKDEELKKAEGGLDSLTEKIKSVGEAFAEGFGLSKAKEFFDAQIEGAAHVQDLAERLGLSASALRTFSSVAKEAGIDSDSAAHALGFLNKNVGEAITNGGESAQTFQKLGISLSDLKTKSPVDLLGDVAEAMSKLKTQPEKAALAVKVFGREGQSLLPILMKGREGVAALSEEVDEYGDGLGDEFYEKSKKARGEMEKWTRGVNAVKARITDAALPAIMRFAEWMGRLIKPVLEFTKDTDRMQRVLEMLAVGAGVKATQTLLKLAKTLGFLKPTVLETITAFLEFALPVLLVAGLGLAIEDLWTAIQGGDSVIGDFLTQLYGTEKAKVVLDDLRKSFEDLKPIWEALKDLGPLVLEGMIQSIPVLGRAFLGLVETVKAFGDSIIAVAKASKELGLSFISGNMDEAIKHWNASAAQLQKGGEKVDKDIDVAGDSLVDRDSMFGNLINGGSRKTADYGLKPSYGGNTAPLPGNAPAVAPQVSNQNQINVTVQGQGKDAKAIGEAVGQGAATELQKVNANSLQAVQVP